MPFTFAHPGYALYLKQRYFSALSVNGLVFGSIAPDLDILLRMTQSRFHLFNYQLHQVLFFILPMALVMSVAFHLIARNTLIDHLPSVFRGSLQNYRELDYLSIARKNFPVLVFSALAGIYLHLFADFLFHWNAFYIMMFFHVVIYPIPAILPFTYYIGWYLPLVLGTLLGFWLIVKFTGIEWKTLKPSVFEMDARTALFWVFFFFVAASVVAIKFVVIGAEINFLLHYIAIHATSGLLVSAFLTPAIFRIFSRFNSGKAIHG